MRFCVHCGKELPQGEVKFCPHCGKSLPIEGVPDTGSPTIYAVPQKRKSWVVALLLSWFLGGLGVDRFYLGYTFLGVLKLLTLGGLGIWALIDFLRIAFNTLPAADGTYPEGREGKEWLAYLLIILTILSFFYSLSSFYYTCTHFPPAYPEY